MLVSFGGMDEKDIKLFNTLTGSGVCIIIFLLGMNLLKGDKFKMAKSKIVEINEKITDAAVGGYKKIETAAVDDYTKIRVEDGPENGIPHFYIGDEDCFVLFNDFIIINIKNVRELTQYGNFSPHYHIWLKKEV